jgi:DNA-binding transcriptional ArsR family regulator
MPSTGCPAVLKALSDETRWRIVQMLLKNERANVNELSEKLKVTQPNISKHLRILREAGVVVSEKEGTTVWCRVEPAIRQQLRGGGKALDLGCCSFRFDR